MDRTTNNKYINYWYMIAMLYLVGAVRGGFRDLVGRGKL